MTTDTIVFRHPGVSRQMFAFGYELITTITVLFSVGFFVALSLGELESVRSRILINICPIFTLALYYTICWNKTGQTLAQKSWGLKVVDRNGQTLPMITCVKRVILSALLNISCISLIFLLLTKKHQPLQDIILRTSVISSRN